MAIAINAATTKVVVASTVVIWVVYDLLAIGVAGGQATISTLIWRTVEMYPIVGIAIGALIGHLFASMPDTPIVVPKSARSRLAGLVAALAAAPRPRPRTLALRYGMALLLGGFCYLMR